VDDDVDQHVDEYHDLTAPRSNSAKPTAAIHHHSAKADDESAEPLVYLAPNSQPAAPS
jgi:hypothetical protein